MWAILDKKTNVVLGVVTPDAPLEEVKKFEKEYNLILMTLKNSPATIGDIYKNGKFYKQDKAK
jgi:hypothetical protein